MHAHAIGNRFLSRLSKNHLSHINSHTFLTIREIWNNIMVYYTYR